MSYNKYHNKPTIVDNIQFSSIKEVLRYSELKLLLNVKQIKDLQIHPSFLLQNKFIDSMGEKHRAITYEADFSYHAILVRKTKEQLIVEDCKGVKTEVYKLKKKLLLNKYKNIVFREI